MKIALNREAGGKLTDQIVRAVADRVESSLLPAGEQMPSIRNMAASLNVSLVTVSKAYNELEEKGYITCIAGKGCFVASLSAGTSPKEGRDATAWQMSLIDYLPRAQLWRHYGGESCRYQFHLASIQPELLPTDDIVKHIAKQININPLLMAEYGAFQGDAGLRQAISESFVRKGISATPEEILITSGAQQGIDLIARTFVGPGDIVYTEAPTYTGAIDVFTSRGAKLIAVPMDEQGMRTDILTKLCDVHPPKLIYTVPTFQNPTGLTMSAARRKQLLNLAQAYSSIIVEDDPFSELYFSEQPPAQIKTMDTNGHVIYVRSYSKLLSPGCRIAAVAATGSILSRLIAAKTTTDLGSPALTQRALLAFITSKRYLQYMQQLRSNMRSRYELVIKLLRRHAPSQVSWVSPGGGLNLWLTLPPWCNANQLYVMAQNESISLLPGSVCYTTEPMQHHFRLCFSQMNEAMLEEGIVRLSALLHVLLKEKPPAALPTI